MIRFEKQSRQIHFHRWKSEHIMSMWLPEGAISSCSTCCPLRGKLTHNFTSMTIYSVVYYADKLSARTWKLKLNWTAIFMQFDEFIGMVDTVCINSFCK